MLRARTPRLRAAPLALAAACLACAAQRTLVIDSLPQGAEVRLDNQRLGTTPVEHEFLHYGARRITVFREGYRLHSERRELRPPWYGRFPIDFVSEVLLPFGWRDRKIFVYVLEPERGEVEEPDLAPVLQRAERLRRAGPEGPLPEPPPVRPEESR
jgi:hypothetical protein